MVDTIRLLIELDGEPLDLDGADGAVVAAKQAAAVAEAGAVIGDPEQAPDWRGRAAAWVADGGLEAARRLRAAHPDLHWVPRVQVYRPSVTYRCGGRYPGEGFRVYMPDTGALRGYCVDDGGVGLANWLRAVEAEGFGTVWLVGRDAAAAGRGLDLEMLDRAAVFPGQVWVSGGATEPRHLEALRREGGAGTVVVPAAVARAHGVEALIAALRPAPAPAPAATAPEATV